MLNKYEINMKKIEIMSQDGNVNVSGEFTPAELCQEILDKIDVVDKKILTFNIEFVLTLVHKYNVKKPNITIYTDDDIIRGICERCGVKSIDTMEPNMKFDVIVGNPPFSDPKMGGNNKIYNTISKQSLAMLKEDGAMAFITPTSVLKKRILFNLVGQKGLKHVGFDADNSFDVKVNICSWVIDRTYTSPDVDVVYLDGTSSKQNHSNNIYDYSVVDRDFVKIYDKLKSAMDKPSKRMFENNGFGGAVVKDPTDGYPYTLYSINTDTKKKTVFGYSRREPFSYQKRKILIPTTKTLTEDSILIDTDDFYSFYRCLEVQNQDQIDNIKSFLLSEYFTAHSAKWKKLDGCGFNLALRYLPKFDIDKKWTNDDVKEFIEGPIM